MVDLGIPKDHATEYPALAYLRNGLADVLLVVRAPVFDAADLVDVEDSADLLESYLLPASQPIAWVTVPALRRLGLLPADVRLPALRVSGQQSYTRATLPAGRDSAVAGYRGACSADESARPLDAGRRGDTAGRGTGRGERSGAECAVGGLRCGGRGDGLAEEV